MENKQSANVTFKKCTGPCGKELEACADNFQWRKDSNKWRNECKECRKKYAKEYYEENKEHIIKQCKEYYEENKEKILDHKKEYHKKYYSNPENRNRKHKRNKEFRSKPEIKERIKEYYEKNKEKILTKQNEYNSKNKERIKERNKKHQAKPEIKERTNEQKKKYYEENKEQILEYQKKYRSKPENIKRRYEQEKNRIKNDPFFAMRKKISWVFRNVLKKRNINKTGPTFEILGYSKQQLKEHIESQFEWWMNWSNWGVYNPSKWDDNNPLTWTWQIDHIIPQSKLPYDSIEHQNFKKCWALENLRPYSAKQNILDGNRRYFETTDHI